VIVAVSFMSTFQSCECAMMDYSVAWSWHMTLTPNTEKSEMLQQY